MIVYRQAASVTPDPSPIRIGEGSEKQDYAEVRVDGNNLLRGLNGMQNQIADALDRFVVEDGSNREGRLAKVFVAHVGERGFGMNVAGFRSGGFQQTCGCDERSETPLRFGFQTSQFTHIER